jgi:hypothetical protein
MILPRFLVRPCELPVKKDDDHAISPAWYLERAVNAVHGTSADRPAQLVFIYFSWQLLQAARNCPISLLNSSRRLALLASWANFEAVEARS